MLKKREKEFLNTEFKEITQSLIIQKKEKNFLVKWKLNSLWHDKDIDLNSFKIYSQNEFGDTKKILEINEMLSKQIVDYIIKKKNLN